MADLGGKARLCVNAKFPGAATFRVSMNRQSIVSHTVWALLAGGAWWLGSRQGGAGEKESAASRILRAPSAETGGGYPAAHGSAAFRESRSVGEAAAWLQPWQERGGIIAAKMAEAVAAALSDPDSVRGLRHFTHLLQHLTPENARAAMESLKANPGARESGAWMKLLCSAWGAQDGAAALGGLQESSEREIALTAWAAADPAAAQQWLAALPADADKRERREYELSLVRGMARRDTAEAVNYIAAQPERMRGDLVRVVAKEQFDRGAVQAAQWAGHLEDSTMRSAALEMVARRYMSADPPAGAAWAAGTAGGPDMRAAVGRVADRIAEKDVLAALAWTQQLPAGPGQEEAYQQVFSEWARQDPSASSQELLRMNPGRERDMAIHSFSRILVNESPVDALTWAGAISDPAQRLETQIDVARTWHAASPAEAAGWITAHLPAGAQSRALDSQ